MCTHKMKQFKQKRVEAILTKIEFWRDETRVRVSCGVDDDDDVDGGVEDDEVDGSARV